jgi:hypothetical protein
MDMLDVMAKMTFDLSWLAGRIQRAIRVILFVKRKKGGRNKEDYVR